MNPTVQEQVQQLAAACSDPRNHNKDDLQRQGYSLVAAALSGSAPLDLDDPLAAGTTTNTPDQVLALLLQTLGPAFATSHACRASALSALTGALKACQSSSGEISHGILSLLGNFLLGHTRPLENQDTDEDDEDEVVRDTAMVTLSSLLQIQIVAAEATSTTAETIGRKIALAKTGVENRIAVAVDDASYPMIPKRQGATINGLSLLPRSRRSLCFDLLQACTNGIASSHTTSSELSSSMQRDLTQLVVFACDCLHGESDPRCLLQLLQLLRSLLTTLKPFFIDSSSSSSVFPTAEIFDAISSYYPIQFNPPPNNPHGITKEGLQSALRSILCCIDYDAKAKLIGTDTMLSLSLGMILEQISPFAEDEPTTLQEKLDALGDLECLLFQTFPAGNGPSDEKIAFSLLDPAALQSISQAMLSMSQEVSQVSSDSNSSTTSNLAKHVAEKGFMIVAKIALECEANISAWHVFTECAILSLSESMTSSSSYRTSIAYIANLCSCGGVKTLNFCLQKGLEPLLHAMNTRKAISSSVDNTAAGLYGVGAFFAAARKTIGISSDMGVVISPHPLLKYGATAAELLTHFALTMDPDNVDSLVLATAAVRALDSVLLAAPAESWTDAQIAACCEFMRGLVTQISALSVKEVHPRDRTTYREWLIGCAEIVGSTVGRKGDAYSFMGANYVLHFVEEDLTPQLVTSVTKSMNCETRYDWMAIAIAARSNRSAAASHLLGVLADALRDRIENDEFDQALSCSNALNLLFRLGGPSVAELFHQLQSPATTIADIIETIASTGHPLGESVTAGMLSSSMNSLKLPPTNEEEMKFDLLLDFGFQLGCLLRPAWAEVNPSRVTKILLQTSKALPPLSDADFVRLAVTLPILSAGLSGLSLAETVPPIVDTETIRAFLPDLMDFVLRPENHAGTRSHAAICIQILVSYHVPRTEDCPVIALVNDFLMPVLQEAVAIAKGTATRGIAHSLLKESLTMVALLCVSAACRGGDSLNLSNRLIEFLIDLACSGESELTIGGDRSILLSLNAFHDETNKYSDNVSTEAAACFGSIFSMQRGNYLWKQRLMLVASNRLEKKWNGGHGCHDVPPPAGLVTAVCYMICLGNSMTLSSSTLELAKSVISQALSPQNQSKYSGCALSSVKKLVLGTFIKLIAVAPTLFKQNAPYMATGVIRAYVSGTSSSPTADIACKLLALQALDSLIKLDKDSNILQYTRPAVVSVLKQAMNHPSIILRDAAVEVRNVWCLN